MADAVQAYIQAVLKGDACWICLPRDRWPSGWGSKFRKPVVRLHRALYGHPDGGTVWERHRDQHVCSVGFQPLGPEWPSVYRRPKLNLLLAIYVDDFKLGGAKSDLAKGWSLLRKGLDTEPETPLGIYLGCNCVKGELILPDGQSATSVSDDMESFLEQRVQRYLATAGAQTKLKIAETPFLPEDQNLSPQGAPLGGSSAQGPRVECPWRKHTFTSAAQSAQNACSTVSLAAPQ
jgi:hypothetical protein